MWKPGDYCSHNLWNKRLNWFEWIAKKEEKFKFSILNEIFLVCLEKKNLLQVCCRKENFALFKISCLFHWVTSRGY